MESSHDTHAHPTTGLYLKIGVILFVLTALEVGAYELVHGEAATATTSAVLGPILVPILLILSGIKFALVAMFYMHLKQDAPLFSGLLVFPLIIAGILAVALVALFGYLRFLHA